LILITIAIANQKGGTGKTTSTVNLAAALARAGKHVLLIDLDPQASLSEYYFSPTTLAESNQTIYDALVEKKEVKVWSIGNGRDLIPATIDLAAADLKLASTLNRERILVKFLKAWSQQYDYCLIDCSPSLGVLTINALTASAYAFVPVETELLGERTVKLILDTIEEVKELNPDLKVWRIVATKYDMRLAHHKEILEALRRKYGTQLYVEPVKSTTKYKDAAIDRQDISELDSVQGEYWDRLAAMLISETIH
jgi:chromosome partitioning protein